MPTPHTNPPSNQTKLNLQDIEILSKIGITQIELQTLSVSEVQDLIRSKYQIYCQKYVFSTANTYPNISCGNDSSVVEHEASTGKISEQVLFFLMSRGLSQEDAISLVVSGFCSEVLTNLPFEFAVEAKKLLQVSMEGSVG